MSDPRKPLPSLEDPKWLKDLIAGFPDKPDVIRWGTNVFLEQVNRERMARLAELSQATASIRATIAANALDHRESQKWILWTGRIFEGPEGSDAYLPGNNKCNLFVYEMLTQAGVPIPLVTYDSVGRDRLRPPLAGQWGNPNYEIPGFELLTVPPDVPQPGDIAAIARESFDATGHVGIVASSPNGTPNWTVSGRSDGVVHEDWGFRGKDNFGPVVFRRFVGTPK